MIDGSRDELKVDIANTEIMWASSMALAGFQFLLGKPMFAFPLHGMGHELSSKYDMTHGDPGPSYPGLDASYHAHRPSIPACVCAICP